MPAGNKRKRSAASIQIRIHQAINPTNDNDNSVMKSNPPVLAVYA
jgi:hypothetical protein